MFERKRIIAVTDRQQRVMVRWLSDARNGAIREGKPTEDLDEVILKAINAPTSSSRTSYRLFSRKREKCAHSVAPPLPTESSDSAGTPSKKRRADRETR